MSRIVIAGGGVTGLSIAHAIGQRDPRAEVVVLEPREQVGGNIHTEVVEGYTCEWGADGFLDNAPATLKLAEAVGLGPRLLPSRDAARRRFIYLDGRLHEVPVSVLAFLTSRLLSLRGKGRVAWEPFAAPRRDDDESIHAFAARRIGEEAAAVLIDSMVSGIFAGDARALSLRACFPKMWQMETDHGSLVRAFLATRRNRKRGDAVGAPAGRLTSFTSGMRELTDAVARALGDGVRTASPVVRLGKGQERESLAPGRRIPGYTVGTPDDSLEADAVVLTGAAAESADLIRPFDDTLASLLTSIETAPLAVVCLGFDEAALAQDRGPLNGFGFLVPRRQGIRILGALWETSIYPHRAPAGKALLRAMIGGAGDPLVVGLGDDELLAAVRTDLHRTMGLSIAPEFTRVIRHQRGIPQYTRGHLGRLQRIDARLAAHPGLFLAGNSYRGVSINSCVAEAGDIAERVLNSVNSRPPTPNSQGAAG